VAAQRYVVSLQKAEKKLEKKKDVGPISPVLHVCVKIKEGKKEKGRGGWEAVEALSLSIRLWVRKKIKKKEKKDMGRGEGGHRVCF